MNKKMSTKITSDLYGQFVPRYIGPMGNRVSAVAGVPGNSLVYYAGCASGGIFKTIDGGTHWKPIFDHQAAAVGDAVKPEKVSSIGALAVSESHPDIVWAGTGESWIRGPISIGNGVYKSSDGGENWTRMGLFDSGRISKIVINPDNPEIVWVAAMGSCYDDAKAERGVYKTVDGGLTWTSSLWVDENTGCSDLSIDPNNPDVIYAGMWEFKLRSWTRVSGGYSGGVFKSFDGGATWAKLTNGLPYGEDAPNGKPFPVGKISVGVSRKKPNYVYANIETGDGEPTWDFHHVANGQLWQSTDGGKQWKIKSYNRNLNSRCAYYTRNEVSPDNELEVYFFAPKFTITKDGGETLDSSGFPESPGVDHHDGWIDPTNGDRMIVAHDIGISITQNRCKSWYKIQLPNAQIYQIGVDDQIPYNVYGNVQDWVAFWGPNNARIPYNFSQGDLRTGKISRGLWTMGGSGECGWTFPDPKDPDLIWSSGSNDGPNGGSIALIHRKSGHTRIVTVKPNFTTGSAPKDVKYRFHWHLPLAISPHDDPGDSSAPRRVYAGSQFVHVTDTQGQSWYEISDEVELTGYDEEYLQSSGGLTGDNLNVRMAYTVSSIVESPKEQGLLWVGTSDQRIWLGRQKGYNDTWKWEEITKNIKELPKSHPGAWAKITCIAPSIFHAGTAYISFDRHEAGDPSPYVFKTTDHGKNWEKITNHIPESVFSYVHWIAEDPKCKGLLFLGTENALYISYNEGGSWQVLPGLPPAPVSGVVVQPHFDDLVISTFGRGFYIYDDMTLLRKLTEVIEEDVHLFEFSRPVYRFQNVNQPLMIPNDNDPTVGSDPESPAPISFYLKAPSEKVTISIYEVKKGKKDKVRTINVKKGVKGINRVWWDLMSDTTQTIILRTNPANQMETPYCELSNIRPFSDPIAGTTLSWMVLPGIYEVSLEVEVRGKKILKKQQLELLKDPTSSTNHAELVDQNTLSQKIAGTLNKVAIDINRCEWIRYQIESLEATSKALPPDLTKALKELDKKIIRIECSLFQVKITGNGEDLARFPAKLVSNLAYLGGIVGTGDFPPTDQQRDQFKTLESEIKDLDPLLNQSLERLKEINQKLEQQGLLPLSSTPPDEELCSLFSTGPAF